MDLMKILAATIVATSLISQTGNAQRPAPVEEVLLPGFGVPLPGRWMRASDARSGVPLGGLGTGFLELRADSRLHDTVTSNNWLAPARLPGGSIRLSAGRGSGRREAVLLASAAGSERPSTARYFGHYPMADMDYGRPLGDVPVEVWMRAHGALVPAQHDLSNLPVAFFHLRFRNHGLKPVQVQVNADWPGLERDERAASGNVAAYLGWRRPQLRPGESWLVGAAQRFVVAGAGRRPQPPRSILTLARVANFRRECTLPGSRLERAHLMLELDAAGGWNWEPARTQTAVWAGVPTAGQILYFLEWNGQRAGLEYSPNQPATATGLRLVSAFRTNRTKDRGYCTLETLDGTLRLTVLVELVDASILRWFLIENRSKQAVRAPGVAYYLNADLGGEGSAEDDVVEVSDGVLRRMPAAVFFDPGNRMRIELSACGLQRPTHAGAGEWKSALERVRSGDWSPTGSARRSPEPRIAGFRSDLLVGVQAAEASRRTVALGARGRGWTIVAGRKVGVSAYLSMRAQAVVMPGAVQHLTIAVSWHAPTWKSSDGRLCLNRYATRWLDARACLLFALPRSEEIERHIIAWQESIARKSVPGWLRDALINSLYSLTRNTIWLDDGRFFHSESFTGCPITETLVCRFNGSFPILMLFPELEAATLKQFAAHQAESGQIPFAFGAPLGVATPIMDLQRPIVTSEYVLLCWRAVAWTKDDRLLAALYPSVKKALAYVTSLDADDDGLVNDAPGSDTGFPANQYYDVWPWFGTSAYTAGLGLAAWRAGEEMARRAGDEEFASRCADAFGRGRITFEEKLWNGSHYRLYNDFDNGRMSETSLSNQLCGQWFAWLCDLGDLHPFDHALSALRTVAERNARATPYGAVSGVLPDNRPDESGTTHSRDVVLGEVWNWATTAVYAARRAGSSDLERAAMEAAESAWGAVVRSGTVWNQHFNYSAVDGKPIWGRHYYSNMCLWALPFALDGTHMRR